MSQWSIESDGDNIEFTAAAIGDYTIYFQHNINTSANDTEFVKYPNNTVTARKFEIRCDKSADLIQVGSTVLTDPAQITVDKPHIENRNVPTIHKIKIRTSSTNTMIKTRWF